MKQKKLTVTQKKALWSELKLALQLSDRQYECSLLIKCVVCYETKRHKLFLLENITWNTFIKGFNFSDRTLRRYLAAAELIELWVSEHYPGRDYLSATDVEDFVEERNRNGYSSDIKTLLKERQISNSILRHLNGEITMKPTEFTAAMTPPTIEVAPKVITTETNSKAKGTQFPVHEKILAAGYTYEPKTGKYYDEETNELSTEAYSEFVDKSQGLKIFDEAEKIVSDFEAELQQLESFRKDFLAYSKTHRSPADKRTIAERHKAIEEKTIALVHRVSTMLNPK